MCFKNPKMDNQESIQEPPNQDLACSAQIYAAILRKLLEDIIKKVSNIPFPKNQETKKVKASKIIMIFLILVIICIAEWMINVQEGPLQIEEHFKTIHL